LSNIKNEDQIEFLKIILNIPQASIKLAQPGTTVVLTRLKSYSKESHIPRTCFSTTSGIAIYTEPPSCQVVGAYVANWSYRHS